MSQLQSKPNQYVSQMAMLLNAEGKAICVGSGATMEDALAGLLKHDLFPRVTLSLDKLASVMDGARLKVGSSVIVLAPLE